MTRLQSVQHDLLEREHASRAAAETANRVKDQFLAVVSHELRTPLNAILGWADMLCRGKIDESRREHAAVTIRDSAKRQAQLIDDLLDVARISSGKLRLQRAVVDLQEVVFDAVHVIQPLSDAKGVHIRVEVISPLDGVHGDAARLQQVVWNLLSNAVKFTPAGGSVSVTLSQRRDRIELLVADTGSGISADFLPLIFEPFRQADGSSTRAHPGLGLGLAIVKSLVEAHGGSVTAQSQGAGLGASFLVTLPAMSPSKGRLPDVRVRAGSVSDDEPSLHGISVLVVDDEPESREVVAAQLQGFGAAVTMAGSAAAALEVLAAQHVDVLVADIGMPGVDGYSMIRQVRALPDREPASVPAVALTALARKEDRQRALQAGFQLHLAKPADARSLAAAVLALNRLNSA
jgi:CheY-like chemotaxis protein/nitrogen-specific signal transduction histidine kinase